jgi:DNA topoisomerase VI subunit B
VHYEKADQDKLDLIYKDDGIGVSAQNKPQLFKKVLALGAAQILGYF